MEIGQRIRGLVEAPRGALALQALFLRFHMSRQNKVNPGMYTQRGRLTQDDAARELRKQSAFASPHRWQPVNTRMPRLAPAGDAARAMERSPGNEAHAMKPAAAERVTRSSKATRSRRVAPPRARARTATTRKSTSMTGTTKPRTTATARKTVTPRKTATARKAAAPRKAAAARRTVTARNRATTKKR